MIGKYTQKDIPCAPGLGLVLDEGYLYYQIFCLNQHLFPGITRGTAPTEYTTPSPGRRWRIKLRPSSRTSSLPTFSKQRLKQKACSNGWRFCRCISSTPDISRRTVDSRRQPQRRLMLNENRARMGLKLMRMRRMNKFYIFSARCPSVTCCSIWTGSSLTLNLCIPQQLFRLIFQTCKKISILSFSKNHNHSYWSVFGVYAKYIFGSRNKDPLSHFIVIEGGYIMKY